MQVHVHRNSVATAPKWQYAKVDPIVWGGHGRRQRLMWIGPLFIQVLSTPRSRRNQG